LAGADVSPDDGLADAIARAREIADRSIDWRDHRVALALEGAAAAREWRRRRDADPPGRTDDLPPWSEVSKRPDGH
jgi:hypothetical protein